MCGIAGRLNFRSGAPVDPGILHGMGDLLAHRGPDGEGLWHQGPSVSPTAGWPSSISATRPASR